MGGDFSTKLTQRITAGAGPAVVGLDPRLSALPADLAPRRPPAERIVAFYREAMPLLAAHVPVVKPNIAFFERYGAAGFAAYETTCGVARELGLLVIGDIKRGDIGSTAAAYADFHMRVADAVTLQPYLGEDSVAPFLDHCRDHGKAVFVLVRTSNPSASDFQDVATAAGTLAEQVATAVDRWGAETGPRSGFSLVGAVVGATRPEHIAGLRARMPRAWFLLPGVGAQGGVVEDCRPAFDHRGLGGLISQSRSIMQCFDPGDADWRERLDRAAASFGATARSFVQNPVQP